MDWANEATFIVYKHITDLKEFGEIAWGEAVELYYADQYVDDDEKNAMETLADWLKERVTYDDNPLGSGLYFDLIMDALKKVDWYDIADVLLKRVKREEYNKEE